MCENKIGNISIGDFVTAYGTGYWQLIDIKPKIAFDDYTSEDLKWEKGDIKLLQSIEESKNFVLILSPESLERCQNEGDWVRCEIEHAIKCDKNIIPLMLSGFVKTISELLCQYELAESTLVIVTFLIFSGFGIFLSSAKTSNTGIDARTETINKNATKPFMFLNIALGVFSKII